MDKHKIILITGENDFFGQTRKAWVSLNTLKLIENFKSQGYQVEKYHYHELVNQKKSIENSIIFYSFSQKDNVRNYLTNLIFYLHNSGNLFIPSLDLLKCHEDKGYQELYKKKLGIPSLKAIYVSGQDELENYDIKFPMVVKTTGGSNSKGVFLAKNRKGLIKIIHKINSDKMLTKIDLLRRRYLRRKKSYLEYPDYSNREDYFQYKHHILNENEIVLQEFIPDLTFDYRVLIMFDKYYITKRHTHKNDFRASGAKKFDYDFDINPELLDYAKMIYDTFDTPYISLDIAPYGKTFRLLEFQALHFGINVFVKNDKYFTLEKGLWKHNPIDLDFEKEMAHALIQYIEFKLR